MFKRIVSAAVIFGTLALAPPAQAQTANPCIDRTKIVRSLTEKYNESQTALGLQNSGQMLEIWTSADTGTFTVLITRADGISCIVSSGEFWRTAFPVADKKGLAG